MVNGEVYNKSLRKWTRKIMLCSSFFDFFSLGTTISERLKHPLVCLTASFQWYFSMLRTCLILFHQRGRILPRESTCFIALSWLDWIFTTSAITKISELTSYHSPTIKRGNLLWSLFHWHGSCHVPPLVASIMAKFEQMLWEHFGNILNEVLRVIKTVDKHAIDFIG